MLKNRIGVLEAACEVAERRQASMSERLRARGSAFTETLSRLDRLSEVEAEQGKVDWVAEVKQLRANIKMLDALPDANNDPQGASSSSTAPQAAPPIIVKAEDGGSFIATCAGEMGRKRRRFSQPESPSGQKQVCTRGSGRNPYVQL